MRKNIFEVLEKDLDYKMEVKSIKKLLENNVFIEDIEKYFGEPQNKSLLSIVNKFFLDWEHRGNANSLNNLLDRLEVNYIDINTSYTDITMEEFLLFCEAVYNACNHTYNKDCYRNARKPLMAIMENINNAITKLGYEIYTCEDEEKSLIVINNEKAVVAANKVDKSFAKKIIEYNNYILKGDVEGKKIILKSLADLYEKNKNKLKQNGLTTLLDDIGFLLNNLNIRHNNKDAKNDTFMKGLTKKQLESWYDKTYELIITSVLDLNRIKISDSIKDFKQKHILKEKNNG